MSDRGGPPKKKSESFNNPFKAALSDLKKKQAEPPKKPQASRPQPSKSKRGQEEDDMSLFFSAMDGVQQITNRGEAPCAQPAPARDHRRERRGARRALGAGRGPGRLRHHRLATSTSRAPAPASTATCCARCAGATSPSRAGWTCTA